jgi:hypothetical protein
MHGHVYMHLFVQITDSLSQDGAHRVARRSRAMASEVQSTSSAARDAGVFDFFHNKKGKICHWIVSPGLLCCCGSSAVAAF